MKRESQNSNEKKRDKADTAKPLENMSEEVSTSLQDVYNATVKALLARLKGKNVSSQDISAATAFLKAMDYTIMSDEDIEIAAVSKSLNSASAEVKRNKFPFASLENKS